LKGLTSELEELGGGGKAADRLREQIGKTGEVNRILGDVTGPTAHVDDGEAEGAVETLL